mmetsp:Transcript_13306/g.44464  ORF Transcript_13306/g.44464 Transcript_13306/m.44464 type:complete len:260 (-) Transcript_13306:1053-1832(-)
MPFLEMSKSVSASNTTARRARRKYGPRKFPSATKRSNVVWIASVSLSEEPSEKHRFESRFLDARMQRSCAQRWSAESDSKRLPSTINVARVAPMRFVAENSGCRSFPLSALSASESQRRGICAASAAAPRPFMDSRPSKKFAFNDNARRSTHSFNAAKLPPRPSSERSNETASCVSKASPPPAPMIVSALSSHHTSPPRDERPSSSRDEGPRDRRLPLGAAAGDCWSRASAATHASEERRRSVDSVAAGAAWTRSLKEL